MNRNISLPLFIALCHIPIFFLHFSEIHKKPLPKKKIIVHTIHLLEEPVKTPTYTKKSASKQVVKAPPKKKAPTNKVPKRKKVIAKKAPPKKKPVKKLSKKKIQNKLNKSLASAKPHYVGKKSPAKKNTKNDAGKEKSEYNKYLQTVAGILRDALTLPEKGKVKLTITTSPLGKISKIVTQSSESACNLSYLEENLAKLTLPKYKKKEDRIFTIVFCDEK